MPLPDMPDHLISEALMEFSAFDPAAFAVFCATIREGNSIQAGTIIADLCADYLSSSAPDEPAHSTERLDFARSGRPAMDKCFTER